MYSIRVVTMIAAPVELCFDLARSIDAHAYSTRSSGERAVAGRTGGLIELGEEVTWEAKHFGVRQRLTSRITKYDRPFTFQDCMVRGAFASFEHDHLFQTQPEGQTEMVDLFRFEAPLGPLGWLAERLVLGWYLRRFLEERGRALKALAESEEWRRFLPEKPVDRQVEVSRSIS